MDLLLELETVQETVSSYKRISSQLGALIKTAEGLKNGIDDSVWSGKSKEQFDNAFQAWINETSRIASDISQTQNIVANFAGGGGDELKRQSERMVEHF